MSKRSAARVLLVAAVAAIGWSIVVFATGGFVWETAAFRLSSHDPFRPLVAGVIGLLAYWYLAPQAVTTFISGESGTGKERVARAVHGLSARAAGPFTAVNVAAVP